MQTRCPLCQTQFHVRREQIEAAGGMVRCGECLEIFDARPALTNDSPEPSPPAFLVSAASYKDGTSGRAAPVPERAPAPTGAPASEMTAQRLRGGGPRPHGWMILAWSLANLLLLVTLLGQYLLINREGLAGRREFQPLIAALCGLAGCPSAQRRDLSAFELTGRTVQSHPDFVGTLLVDATFVNGARFAQPYPAIDVLFSDTENRVVASRRFLPREYLPAPAPEEIAPGGEAHLMLEILDPGEGAVGYEIRFF